MRYKAAFSKVAKVIARRERVENAVQELYQVFTQALGDQAMKAQEEVNRKRNICVFENGDIVFRRMPRFARPPRHMLGEPTRGTEVAMGQRSFSSVVFLGPATNMLVGGGANVPLDPFRSWNSNRAASRRRAAWPTCSDPTRPGRTVRLRVLRRRRVGGDWAQELASRTKSRAPAKGAVTWQDAWCCAILRTRRPRR